MRKFTKFIERFRKSKIEKEIVGTRKKRILKKI